LHERRQLLRQLLQPATGAIQFSEERLQSPSRT
jgi:hypothetical protein